MDMEGVITGCLDWLRRPSKVCKIDYLACGTGWGLKSCLLNIADASRPYFL